MKDSCEMCQWISDLRSSNFFVKELQTGFVVISKYQFNRGYTLFLYKQHATELHQLSQEERKLFLSEMGMVAEAVFRATAADKMNYELLGNTVPHMHWHIIPRYKTEHEFARPIWVIKKSIRQSKRYDPKPDEVQDLREKILHYLP